MGDYSSGLKIIKEKISCIRDDEIRRKAGLIIGVISAKNIKHGCCLYGLCRKTFYAWYKKLKNADFDLNALKNRPRGARISSRRISEETAARLCQIRKETGNTGGRVVSHCYHKETGKKVAPSTIDNIFSRNGLTNKYRRSKKNPHTKRYASEKPLDRVQMDTVGLKIEDNHGNKVYAVTGIDCHSRFAFSYCCLEKSTHEAHIGLIKLIEIFGKPKLVQTDNGVEFTYLFVSRSNAKRKKSEERYAPFESMLERENIEHCLIKPRTPAHNGKVERFHRSLLGYIRSRELNGKPLEAIKSEVRKFIKFYNEEKPHTSLYDLTPAEVFYKHHSLEAA